MQIRPHRIGKACPDLTLTFLLQNKTPKERRHHGKGACEENTEEHQLHNDRNIQTYRRLQRNNIGNSKNCVVLFCNDGKMILLWLFQPCGKMTRVTK